MAPYEDPSEIAELMACLLGDLEKFGTNKENPASMTEAGLALVELRSSVSESLNRIKQCTNGTIGTQ